MTEIGKGSRRVCFRLPDSQLCVKRYRDDGDVGGTVRKEIARFRFDRRRNTCAREYDYIRSLEAKLPHEVFAVFPETMELREDPVHGWQLVETLVLNGDGSMPERFSRTCRAANAETRYCLLAAFRNLAHAFEAAAVRFYDPQNVLVQWLGKPFEGEFRLRIVDFEPASRTLLPIDSLCPAFRRMKLHRRVKRYLWQHVAAKYDPLPWRERAKWDALVKDEGTKIGLTDCRAFIENKLVNDVFYEGTFRGQPCIVKCSSRAPESIANEYEMSRRLAAVNSGVCAEPLTHWRSPDGEMAFVVMRRLPGPTLSALLDAGISETVAAGFAADALEIDEALERAAISHRDIFPGNLMLDDDGHLRLIDLQFSVDFDRPQPDVWLRQHPKYHYLSLGIHPEFGIGVWNDAESLSICLGFLPQTDAVRAARTALKNRAKDRFCRVPVTALERCRIFLYAVSLSFQVLFRPTSEKRARLSDRRAKVKQLLWKGV